MIYSSLQDAIDQPQGPAGCLIPETGSLQGWVMNDLALKGHLRSLQVKKRGGWIHWYLYNLQNVSAHFGIINQYFIRYFIYY